MKKALLGFSNGIRLAFAVGAISLLGSQFAMATNLFWSANGAAQGGAGTWNTTTANRWGTAAGGPYTLTWNNANADSAEFGGTTGQINLGGPITVNLITTKALGFNIGNGNAAGTTNTINFTGANAGVFTDYASGSTTLSAVIGANSIVNKTGTGRMEMGNGNNPNSVRYVLKAGIQSTASIARASASAPGALAQDFWTFDGGGWGINTGNQDTGANRGITVKSGGAFFGSSTLTLNITISSPIVGTEGGGVTVTNVGPFVGNAHQAGAVVMLNNGTGTPNSWDGPLTIASGTVRENLNNQVPNTAVVTQAAGTTFDLGTVGVTDTVKSISGTGGTIALGSAGKLTINAAAGEVAQQVLTGTAGSQLIKNNAGALTLTGSSTGFAGEILLNGGTLGIGGVNSLGSNTANPTFQINGGVISNNSATGRSMSANLKVNVNANFTADDSLAGGTAGQITFQGISTLVGGSKTITVNGTANLGFDDLRETVAGSKVIKDGNGILAFTSNANTATSFTGDVKVLAGKLQVGGTPIIGTGNNTVELAGGALNTSANRTVATNPITNPINVTADSAITTTSAAATVNMAMTSNSIAGGAATTLTLRNDGADGAADLFRPRLSGSGFDYQGKIKIDNGAVGKTQFESANTGATIQTFSGDISGNGALYRTTGAVGTGNGGTTDLKGNNTYSGGTVVEEGTLLVNNTTGSGTGSGDVTVGASGRLGGNGTIAGNVNSTGTLAAGNSIGSLDIGASLAMTAGNFDWEFSFGGGSPAQNADVVGADLWNVAGTLTIANTVALNGFNLGTIVPPLNVPTKFTLISYQTAGTQLQFAGKPNNTYVTVGGKQWVIKYDDTPAGSLNGGTYANAVTLTAVPEASTFIVIGLGGVFAFAAVRLGKRMGVNVLKV